MKNVLVVDDEPHLRQSLRQGFNELQPEWHVDTVASGPEALTLLAQAPFDAVISDLAMPNMDGAAFLSQVKQFHPHMIRFMLSGQIDWKVNVRSMNVAHQFWNKPCHIQQLVTALDRSMRLRDRLCDPRLRRLVAEMPAVPSLPHLYMELLTELRSPDPSTLNVAQIVARDPGMVSKLLQLVNSAIVGLPHRIGSAYEAVFYLGLETITTLVLCLQIFALHERVAVRESSYANLWAHSIATGMQAQHIASLEQGGETSSVAEQSFTAGLLHDVGKLLLANTLPHRYAEALKLQQQYHWSAWRAEKEIFSATHAEVGAYLLGLWGLPEEIVEAVAFHHEPALTLAQHFHFSPLTAVHAANALCHAADGQWELEEHEVDLNYLAQIGLDEHFNLWREQSVKEEGHLDNSLVPA